MKQSLFLSALATFLLLGCNTVSTNESDPIIVENNELGKPSYAMQKQGPKNETVDTNWVRDRNKEMETESNNRRASLSALSKSTVMKAATVYKYTFGMITKDPRPDCQNGADYVKLWLDDEDKGNWNKMSMYRQSYTDFVIETVIEEGQLELFLGIGGAEFPRTPFVSTKELTSRNTQLTLCPENRASLPQSKTDYMVISLSNTCPTGTHLFQRFIDAEDVNNKTLIYPVENNQPGSLLSKTI